MHASERDTERVRKRREEYQEEIKRYDPADFIFIDESGSNIAMTREYARSARGTRAHGSAPMNWMDNITLIGAISLGGMVTMMTMNGGTDVPSFLTFLKELLVPQLREGHIVVMDNLRPHKSRMVEQLIEQAGARVLYLPPYSPDFNPIELCWSKIKALLRKYGARTRRALDRAVGQAIDLVTPSDIRGWYSHCGYAV